MNTRVTYFALAGYAVKIGSTRSIATRMATLQVSCHHRIELIKTSDIEEREAHAIASKLGNRLKGEWFTASPQLIDWINQLPTVESVEIPNTAPKVQSEERKNAQPVVINLGIYVDFSHYALVKIFQLADLLGITPKEAAKVYLATQARKAAAKNEGRAA